ncbi:MAG: exopolysaccharide production protein, partial [Hyphomicrobiales bacterium]|nr:exopolysaccharide production protein [Hyphomicrobiales bacterium]
FQRQADQLATRRSEQQREETYLKSVISQSDRRIQLLTEQQKNEEESSKQDIDDFERVAKLYEKGNTSITRFSDSRRSMLLSATRILQTSAAIAQVEREREEFRKQLAGLNDKRRLEAFKEMHDATIKLEEGKAKLASTQELLLYSAKMRSQLNVNGASNAEIVIIRQTDKGRERIVAQEDMELSPGDAVEIALDEAQLLSFLPN